MSGYDSAYSGDFVPHNLRYIVNRMENFRFNNLKLQTESQTSASASSKIVVNLPSQGMINLDSLTMCGKIKAITHDVQLPQCGVAGLVQRVDLSIGGQVVDSIQNYNQLYSMLKKWTCPTARNRQSAIGCVTGARAAGTVANRGGDEVAAPFSNGYAGVLSTAGNPTKVEYDNAMVEDKRYLRNCSLAAATNEVPFNYSSWLGLLGKDTYLQLDTLPSPIQISITLDGTNCVRSTNVAASFELNSLYFKVQSVEFPLLSKTLYAMLSRNQPVPISFTRWTNFQFSNAAGAVVNNRFSVATQCLSRVWVTNNLTSNIAIAAQTAAQQDRGIDVGKFLSGSDLSNLWYCELDNRRQSQYDVDINRDGYHWNLSQMGVQNDLDYENLITSAGGANAVMTATGNVVAEGTNNYVGSAWLMLFNFAFNHYDNDGHDSISGVNTMGLSSSLSVNARTGCNGACTTSYFVEQKAVCNILPNRQIEVIY
jgi:hypothetical protein